MTHEYAPPKPSDWAITSVPLAEHEMYPERPRLSLVIVGNNIEELKQGFEEFINRFSGT